LTLETLPRNIPNELPRFQTPNEDAALPETKKEERYSCVAFRSLLDLYWCYVFTALVTEGRVAWDWSVATRASFEPELFRSDVLVHHLGKFGVTQKSTPRLAGKHRERIVSNDRPLCEHTRSSHAITSRQLGDLYPEPRRANHVLASFHSQE
jgi:hypothetical protein